MKLESRIALITGAGQGIGAAIAERFAAEGAKLMLVDIDETKVASIAAGLIASGASASSMRADVSKKPEVDAVVAATIERFGRIDILVNNAGITHAAEFLDLEEQDFDRVLAVNLKSMFLFSQAVARQMIRQTWAEGRGGAIVNMSSVNAVLAIPNQVPYVISKGGVNQLTKVSAIALAAHGIRVNAIGPGTILTEMAKVAVLQNDEARRKILSRSPLGRCGEPEEIAAVAAFLASDDASYLTGQTIYPDGGRLALNYTVPVTE
ncbi:MAG: SDR family NAD(P)-dependent oxidoreductase [Betaproteobacteria bacterium]